MAEREMSGPAPGSGAHGPRTVRAGRSGSVAFRGPCGLSVDGDHCLRRVAQDLADRRNAAPPLTARLATGDFDKASLTEGLRRGAAAPVPWVADTECGRVTGTCQPVGGVGS
ncbi:hypothetical protein ABZ590_40210, partial [Streptomyces hirsutus]|uniref:hypothetical protein n=1 Tax=Streptomyces hirsutus TaxID=35620 RepID=UPI0033F743A4